MKDIKELVEIIKDNFINREGIVDISGMDFGNLEVDISFLKTTNTLNQSCQKVGQDIFQHSHEVEGDLYQDNHSVGVDVHQDNQKVKGNLWQDYQIVHGKLFTDYKTTN